MLAYEPKCLDFQRSIGREEFCMPLADAGFGDIVEQVERLSSDRERHSDALHAAVGEHQRDLRRAIGIARSTLFGSGVYPTTTNAEPFT